VSSSAYCHGSAALRADGLPDWSDFGLACFTASGRTFIVDSERPYTRDIEADSLMVFDECDTRVDDLRRLLSVAGERDCFHVEEW
jgi:hypothetical protein